MPVRARYSTALVITTAAYSNTSQFTDPSHDGLAGEHGGQISMNEGKCQTSAGCLYIQPFLCKESDKLSSTLVGSVVKGAQVDDEGG